MWSAAKEGLFLGFVQQVPQRVVLAIIFSYPLKKMFKTTTYKSQSPFSPVSLTGAPSQKPPPPLLRAPLPFPGY
jgi:hypothetical protein